MSDSNTLIENLRKHVEACNLAEKCLAAGDDDGHFHAYNLQDETFCNLDLEGLLQLVYRLVDYKPTKDASFFWPKPQPIETAPKDGSRFLAVNCEEWQVCSWDGHVWRGEEWIEIGPTHWLPLPPAPE